MNSTVQNPIVFVLVEPENADNIGAAARSMKNMGLRELRLVKPVRGWKTGSQKLAMNATDVIDRAVEFSTVEQAVEDLQYVVGTTRRIGPRRGRFEKFESAVTKIRERIARGRVGIMFGCESKGLDNLSLGLCDALVTIPVSPDYPSINLAQAVMLMAFSLFDKSTPLPKPRPKRGHSRYQGVFEERKEIFLDKNEIRHALDVFEEALRALGYSKQGDKLERIRKTLDGLIKRSGLTPGESQMLKGLSRRIREKIGEQASGASER